ncbi:MAG: DegT/DnrJ/EryC1/StrS aminotransferase family protein [Rubrivivax sp.]|nr:MAG: DegT/DnrJ/EryC1/StrS aminotransferase family protein [Rubrivivax sp.]
MTTSMVTPSPRWARWRISSRPGNNGMTGAPDLGELIPRQAVPGPHNLDHGSSGGDGDALPCLLDRGHLLFTQSGRAAILLGLEALALPPTARILVPSYHCPTMVSPAVALKLQVGFYPIRADGQPDLTWLDANVPSDTRVICVAHLFGLPLDLRELSEWCRRRGLILLEDCAHAMFGASASGDVGSHGEIVIASLPKFFAALDGGLLRLPESVNKCPSLRPLSRLSELRAWLDGLEISARYGRLGRWSLWARPLLALKQTVRGRPVDASPPAGSNAKPHFDVAGDYSRIDFDACHRAASTSSRRAATSASRGRIAALRREHYRAFTKAFTGQPGLRPLQPDLPDRAVPYVFPLWVDSPEAVYEAARQQRMPVSRWDWLWPGVPDMPGDQGKLWSTHVLQLHCHQDLSVEQRGRMIDAVLAHTS